MPAEDWIEVLIQKKPKRLVHNQLLIQTSLVLMIVSPLPIVGLGFWLVFNLHPAITVPAILVAWVIASFTYAALRLHTSMRNKREV